MFSQERSYHIKPGDPAGFGIVRGESGLFVQDPNPEARPALVASFALRTVLQ